ncbi:MAG: cadherin-like domain-containing protein, partial [Anaerolineae bacterium]|nr:cadherin-like domain-containing protein [Anaerolineae bacterium]
MRDNPTIGNRILGNIIYGNTALGIELGTGNGVTPNDGNDVDSGPNNLMNFPVIYSVTITGGNVTISGEARPGTTVEFFESPSAAGANGQAQTFIGRGTVSGSTAGTVDATARQFSFTFAVGSLVVGDRVTATSTTLADGTSEFSVNLAALANSAPVAADDRSGLVFDGVDDFVQLGSDISLEMTSTMTMEAWFRTTSFSNSQQIILNKEGEYEVGVFSDGTIRWAFANTDPGWAWHDTGHVVQLNEWTHVAVTYNNGTIITYVNGSPVDTYNGSGAIGDAHALLDDLRVGGRSNNPAGQYFDDAIGEVRIWNVVRTGGEIATNYDQWLTGAETGLVANLRFTEGAGTVTTDISSSSNDGTLGGGTPSQEPTWVGYATNEDTTLNIVLPGVLLNDTDGDTDPLIVSEINGSAVNIGNPIALPSGALVTLNANGSFTYDPTGQFDNLAFGQQASDQFDYTVDDGNGGTDTATVYITINGVNDAPVVDLNAGGAGQDVTTAFTEQTPVLIAPVGTLSDVDSATLTSLLVTLTTRPDGDAVESLSLNAAAT